MKLILKKHLSMLLATYLNHILKSAVLKKKFDQIMAIENFKKLMILARFQFVM